MVTQLMWINTIAIVAGAVFLFLCWQHLSVINRKLTELLEIARRR